GHRGQRRAVRRDDARRRRRHGRHDGGRGAWPGRRSDLRALLLSAHRLMGRGVGRAAAMGSVFGLGGLTLLPVLALTGAPLLASPQAFAVGAYMALVPMFLGYVLFGLGLTRISASTATTLTLA